MRGAILVLVLVLLCGQGLAHGPEHGTPAARYGHMMAHYANSGDPAAMLQAFDRMSETDFANPASRFHSGAFFSHLIDARPTLSDQLAQSAGRAGPNKKHVVMIALNFSHFPGKLALMRSLGWTPETLPPLPEGIDFKTAAIEGGIDLDLQWASFFATGDPLYVKRVATALNGYIHPSELKQLAPRAKDDPAVAKRLEKHNLALNAFNQLGANALRTPQVVAVLKDLKAQGPSQMATLSRDLLNQVARVTGRPAD